MFIFQGLFEICEGQLVSVLMRPISRRILLHGIICEVDVVIRQGCLLCGIFSAGGAEVAFPSKNIGEGIKLPKEEDFHVLGYEDPNANVKFALVEKQGPLDVLLDDEGVVLQIVRGLESWVFS